TKYPETRKFGACWASNGYGGNCIDHAAARRLRERPLSRVRRGVREAARRRDGRAEPRLSSMRLRRLDPAHPAAGARVAPLRRGSAAAPVRPSALTPPKKW